MFQAAMPIATTSRAPATSADPATMRGSLNDRTRKAAASGMNKTSKRIMGSSPQPPQLGNIQVLKRVANAKDKESHQEHAHQQVKYNTNLNDQRHTECGCQRCQHSFIYAQHSGIGLHGKK